MTVWRRSRVSAATPTTKDGRGIGSGPDRSPGKAVAGWVVGHHIANGDQGVPGDPLPHGHLGAAANLAMWGSMFDDDDDDDDDDL
jgi:hypothetical protein